MSRSLMFAIRVGTMSIGGLVIAGSGLTSLRTDGGQFALMNFGVGMFVLGQVTQILGDKIWAKA